MSAITVGIECQHLVLALSVSVKCQCQVLALSVGGSSTEFKKTVSGVENGCL